MSSSLPARNVHPALPEAGPVPADAGHSPPRGKEASRDLRRRRERRAAGVREGAAGVQEEAAEVRGEAVGVRGGVAGVQGGAVVRLEVI